jgi:hypothetical protein
VYGEEVRDDREGAADPFELGSAGVKIASLDRSNEGSQATRSRDQVDVHSSVLSLEPWGSFNHGVCRRPVSAGVMWGLVLSGCCTCPLL